jgi:myo-inositol-1(or 4)-monophosphatase
MPSLSPILSIMTRAAEKASKSLLRDFGEVEQLQVSLKGPGDFVSAADRRSEETLYAELAKARPDYGFLMEESGAKGAKDAEYRFIIDPLDGTSNFLHGIPHWAISIGLEKGGDLVAGVVYDPVKNEMFYAEKGGGAFMNDRRIRVSGRKTPDKAMCGMSAYLPGQPDYDSFQVLAKSIHTNCYRYRVTGSMALDLSYVACGRFDAHVQSTYSWWDAAAGVLIVKEAGGTIYGLEQMTDPMLCKNLLASNSELMPALRKILGI